MALTERAVRENLPSQSKICDFCQLPQRGSQGVVLTGDYSLINSAKTGKLF